MHKRRRLETRHRLVAQADACGVVAASGTLHVLSTALSLAVRVIGTQTVLATVKRDTCGVEEPVVAVNEQVAVICVASTAFVAGSMGCTGITLPSPAVSAAVHGHSVAVSTECGALIIDGVETMPGGGAIVPMCLVSPGVVCGAQIYNVVGRPDLPRPCVTTGPSLTDVVAGQGRRRGGPGTGLHCSGPSHAHCRFLWGAGGCDHAGGYYVCACYGCWPRAWPNLVCLCSVEDGVMTRAIATPAGGVAVLRSGVVVISRPECNNTVLTFVNRCVLCAPNPERKRARSPRFITSQGWR
jgi:hypothetical protein